MWYWTSDCLLNSLPKSSSLFAFSKWLLLSIGHIHMTTSGLNDYFFLWDIFISLLLGCSYLIEEMMAKHAELEGFSESVTQGNGLIRHLSREDSDSNSGSRCACWMLALTDVCENAVLRRMVLYIPSCSHAFLILITYSNSNPCYYCFYLHISISWRITSGQPIFGKMGSYLDLVV